jgi:PAS domain S-box-containing protein
MTRNTTASTSSDADASQRPPAPGTVDPQDSLYRTLVQEVQDCAIFMLGLDGRVRTWNAGAQRIKGYAAAEIIGQHFSRFYTPEALARGWPDYELREALATGRFEDEGWRVRKDGSLFWANVVITAVHDSSGTLRGFAKVTRDLSERKRLEELERSSQHVSEFLATLAHELRNPLAPLRNAVGVMQLEPSLSPTLSSCRDMIDRQTVQLSRLVDDLLDMGRITTGKIDLRIAPVNMFEVVAQSVEAVRPLADQRQQIIDLHLPPEPVVVEGDFVRLVQVLQNLLNNASKFSPAGGRITIEIVGEARAIVLRVIDQGRGISAGALDTVFTLFAQEDRLLDPTHNGLGIGLTLCRSLVELHGGVITAESAGRGRGCTFSVRLPRARQRAGNGRAAAARPAVTVSAGTLRVLVIDDNRDSADSLAMLIGMKGHEARAAYDGASGLAIARDFVPHLVLVDLAMPDVDGFDVLRGLRTHPSLDRTMTAAMTGFGQNQDRERSFSEGFDAHLVKPVDMALLDDLLISAKHRRIAGDAKRPPS